MMKRLALTGLILMLLSGNKVFAYSDTFDEYSLELKGFSPETIEIVELMVNRQEGRYPPPQPTHLQKMKYNVLNNLWVDPKETFGLDIIDPPKYPVHPKRYWD